MTFVPLNNMISQLRGSANASVVKFINEEGTEVTATTNNSTGRTFSARMPFYVVGAVNEGDSDYAGSVDKLCFTASSASSIPQNSYSVPNKIGSTTNSFTQTSNGWIANVIVTASAPAQGEPNPVINSLFFKKRVQYYGSYYAWINIFALKLDTPVELNAENNYTANFTFAIEF